VSLPSCRSRSARRHVTRPVRRVVIGSGARRFAAAHVDQRGLKVLVLEAGNNYFLGPMPDPRNAGPALQQ